MPPPPHESRSRAAITGAALRPSLTDNKKRDGTADRAQPVPSRLKHRDQDDRFTAPLRPRRELFEALWNFAFWKTKLRRRKAGLPREPISKVNVWCQLRQGALIGRYEAHMEYLGDDYVAMSPRTLRRHMAAFQAMGLVTIRQYTHFDRRRRKLVTPPNVYAITRAGQLWIKKRVGSTKFPLVV